MNIEITDREFDQIIAALRLWQWKGPDKDPELCDEPERQLLEIATEHGPAFTNKAIDAICVRLTVAAKPLALPGGSLVDQLWWFIVNVNEDTPNRAALFDELAEGVRQHGRGEVVKALGMLRDRLSLKAVHGNMDAIDAANAAIANADEARDLLAAFADWAREHFGPNDAMHATLVRTVAFLHGSGKREEGPVVRCAGCGEAWPCSDSKRRDISGRERAKHYVGGSAG